MITKINLNNFKCFNELSLPLSNLTLLTGFNAGGKSSVYQSLLLLSQFLRSNPSEAKIALNGNMVKLGNFGDVLNNKALEKEIVIDVEKNNYNFKSVIGLNKKEYRHSAQINYISTIEDNQIIESIVPNVDELFYLCQVSRKESFDFIKLLSNIIYISAIRGGSLDVFPSPDEPHPVYADVGIEGEFAPWWFYQKLDEEIDSNRQHVSENALTLRRQFNAWAGELFPGAQGHVQPIEKTNLMRLQLRISELDDWLRPANIGYGLSYAFPLIIAGLLAKKDQILIIDSPEAHLHPLGQSKIGLFLAKVAASGVQVIIETHSDHVMNGVRLSLLEKNINSKNVSIHFFSPQEIAEHQKTSQIISPQVDHQGNLSEWPKGFFDQSEKDLFKLAGLD